MKQIALTPRESDVVAELAADGASNEEIAERLGIDYWTVKTHMRHAMNKSGQHSRAALAVAILRRQITVRIVDENQERRK